MIILCCSLNFFLNTAICINLSSSDFLCSSVSTYFKAGAPFFPINPNDFESLLLSFCTSSLGTFFTGEYSTESPAITRLLKAFSSKASLNLFLRALAFSKSFSFLSSSTFFLEAISANLALCLSSASKLLLSLFNEFLLLFILFPLFDFLFDFSFLFLS